MMLVFSSCEPSEALVVVDALSLLPGQGRSSKGKLLPVSASVTEE